MSADRVLTVSPNYATEIMSGSDKGVELNTYLQARGVTGIVNGMDTEEWDPATDKLLTVKYDKTNVMAGKAAAKEQLQAECGLPIDASAPLYAFIGRLEEQKGVDILLAALPKFLAANKKAQVVVLGTGKASMEKQVASLDKQFTGQYKGIVKFSAPLAHIITAGADFFMVPSRFEPCGLIQLHAMNYGTVPVVASTGGLVDTVKEGVTGFHMGALDPDSLVTEDVDAVAATMERAAQVFPTPMFREMVKNAISQDLSWALPARKWEGVLEEVKAGVPAMSTTKSMSVAVPVAKPMPGDKAASPIVAAIKAAEASGSVKPMGAPKVLGLVNASPASPASSGAPSGAPKAGAAPPKAPVGATAGASPMGAPKPAAAPMPTPKPKAAAAAERQSKMQ